MSTILKIAGAVLAFAVLSGCERPSTATAFVLPPGDAASGRDLFISYGCIGCHTIRDADLPEPESPRAVSVPLGGRVARLKSYNELVTSVINPSHKFVAGRRAEEVSVDGDSLMTVYNDVMTVSELIDIVAFLESRYEHIERPGYRYPVYN